jgi:hypothetical protein
MCGGLGPGHAVEITENDREAQPIGKPLDLGVQLSTELVVFRGSVHPQLGRNLLDVSAPDGIGNDLECETVRHPVQPGPQRIPAADRCGPAEEEHERGLERVLRGVRVLQHGAARVQHQRTVACHERGERGFVAGGNEPFQQTGVRQARTGPALEQMLDDPQGSRPE